MSFVARRLFVLTAFAVLVVGPIARGQNTRAWTGLAAPDKNWTTLGNWNTAIPIGGDTALFNSAGNGNTSISLNAAAQPIKSILFDTASAAAYTLGVLSSGDKFNFDASGSITVNSSVTVPQTINAAVQTNGGLTVTNNSSAVLSLAGNVAIGGSGTLTVNNAVANTTTVLGGNITDLAGQPGSLSLLATTIGAGNNNSFFITGTNTYTGPTTIQVNSGASGSIQLGSDSPFGTAPVNLVLVGNLAQQFSALGGTRTIANSFNLTSGMTFMGANSFVFTGPITVINSLSGGARTITNSITAAGKSVTYGASAGSSTITLGQPVASGGDGVGKTAIFSPAASSTTIINDIMQDPGTGATAKGSVQFAGSTGGITQINSLNTYTGDTLLNGLSTVQFSRDYNTGDPSGPFGLGTLTINSITNNVVQPIGGNRTIANKISMVYGLTVANAPGDTSSVTFSGPITMPSGGRQFTNNSAPTGGALIIGSAASPSTVTLPPLVGQTVTIAGTGTTIFNDTIQNPSPAPNTPASILITASGPVALNAPNTYTGDTTITGVSTTIRIGAGSNGLPGPSFTNGPFGTGTIITNSSNPPTFQPTGADRTISNAINMPFGFITANADDPSGPYNLSLLGPITLGATGRIITNNLLQTTSLTLGSIGDPSTISLGSTLTIRTQIVGGGTTNINDAITGIGGLTVQDGATVKLTNSNSYFGPTTLTGTGNSKLLVNGSITGTGAVTVNSAGTLGGTGSIAGPITNSGTIAPGTSIGTLTATGNVSMAANSHLAIEVSGFSADKLAVGGNLDLSNNEFLDLTGTPSGLSVVIATYGTLSGTFNHVTSGYTVNYGTGTNSQISLIVPPTNVNGDFNNDGKVNAADYVIWRKQNPNIPLINDNGLSTPIGPLHYNLWRSNFGNPPASGSGAFDGSAAVPEPATVLFVLLAALGLSAARSRRPK